MNEYRFGGVAGGCHGDPLLGRREFLAAGAGLVAGGGLWALGARRSVGAPPPAAREGRTVTVGTVRELQRAVAEARAGDTILVAPGTYAVERDLRFEDKEQVTLRGASGDPADVVLRGGGWEGGSPRDVITIRRSDDVVIADLSIAEARMYGIKIEPYPRPPHPRNIHIHHCRFLNIATRAIKGTASSDREPVVGGSVRFCTFENTKVPDPSWLFDGDYVSAIDMMFLKDWVFSDNVFRGIRGATGRGGGRGAIFVWNQSRDLLVERNLFVDCDRSIAFGNPSEPTNYEAGTLHVYDSTIRNNFIVVGAGKGIELCWVDGVGVYHNTVYSPNPQRRGIHCFQRIHRVHLANNLVRGRLEYEGDVRAEGNVVGELEGYFVDPQEGDLHLTTRAASALGKGVPLPAVAEDIDGEPRRSPPDVGADERYDPDGGRERSGT